MLTQAFFRIFKYYKQIKIKVMEVVFLQFTLMTVNLFAAKIQKDNNRNPAFNYFVAGMCFGFGLIKLINIYVK